MKIEEIKELAALLEQSELNVLEVSEGDCRIRLEKTAPAAVSLPAAMPLPVQTVPQAMAAGAAGAGSEGQQSAAAPAGRAVKSPMVGVFYGRPAPGETPFVTVGSRVEKGEVLCIIEAMKLMNEIPAEFSGEVAEICVSDGEVVEFGQPLFYLK